MLGDGSTVVDVYNITEPCPAWPDGEPSDSCHRNPWLEPNEWKNIALARLSNEMFGYFRFFCPARLKSCAKIISGV